jgi:hypothetical protein
MLEGVVAELLQEQRELADLVAVEQEYLIMLGLTQLPRLLPWGLQIPVVGAVV